MATHSFVERYLQYGSDDEAVENQLSKQLGKLNKEMLWILLANLGSQMEPDEVNDTTKKQMIELIIPRLNAGVGGLVLAGGNPADQESESSEGKGKGKGNDVMDINAFLEHMGEFVQNLPQGKGKGKGEGEDPDDEPIRIYVDCPLIHAADMNHFSLKSISVHVEVNGTVADIRSELCNQFNKQFSKAELCLDYWHKGTFYGNLDDDKTLEHYHIDSDGARLQMTLPFDAAEVGS
jgi:hypothetical protein